MNSPADLHPLADLLDHVEDVLAWVKDREGHYRWVNRAFLVNYSLDGQGSGSSGNLDEILGKTDDDLSPSFLADQFRLDDESVRAGRRIINRIELVGQPDGVPVWNLTNKIPLLNAAGAVVGTGG